MKTNCSWCRIVMAEHNVQVEDISGMCKKCMKKAYKEMNEWRFEPNTGGLDTHKKPGKTLTQLKSPKGDDEIEDYEHTVDASTEKTQDVLDKYQRKNYKLSGLGRPFGLATSTLGS